MDVKLYTYVTILLILPISVIKGNKMTKLDKLIEKNKMTKLEKLICYKNMPELKKNGKYLIIYQSNSQK